MSQPISRPKFCNILLCCYLNFSSLSKRVEENFSLVIPWTSNSWADPLAFSAFFLSYFFYTDFFFGSHVEKRNSKLKNRPKLVQINNTKEFIKHGRHFFLMNTVKTRMYEPSDLRTYRLKFGI